MRYWRSLYETLRYPIFIIFIGASLLALGNWLVNPLYGVAGALSDTGLLAGRMMVRFGQFIMMYFALLILLRVCDKDGNMALTAFLGYAAYLIATMYWSRQLADSAYSPILGISTSDLLNNGLAYPIQTGVIGILIVFGCILLAKGSVHALRIKHEYQAKWQFFITIILCIVSGVLISYVWPYFIRFIQMIVSFIAYDTANPMNLMLYGIMDRLMSLLGLNTMIRTPFWYGMNGGTWLNVSGTSFMGDVNVWTAQIVNGSVIGSSGKFITPFYVLNLFAIPGLIWGMFGMNTDKKKRKRMIVLAIIASLISFLGGTLFPIELLLLFTAPLLFIMHVAYTGTLFAVFQQLRIYLGYRSTEQLTYSALPGTMQEYVTYASNDSLRRMVIGVLIVGIISFVIYYVVTQLYYRYIAIDLTHSGELNQVSDEIVRYMGGLDNFTKINADIHYLEIGVLDPKKVSIKQLEELCFYRYDSNKQSYRLDMGAGSYMIRKNIRNRMRDSVRMMMDQR